MTSDKGLVTDDKGFVMSQGFEYYQGGVVTITEGAVTLWLHDGDDYDSAKLAKEPRSHRWLVPHFAFNGTYLHYWNWEMA